MTAPIKPWEAGVANLRSEKEVSPLSIQSSSRIPDVNVKTVSAVPPPLPPRPSNVVIRRPAVSTAIGGVPQVYRGYPTTNNYMGGYNSYGGYGNYGAYNQLGGYGGGHYAGFPYNYPNASEPNNRLIALAEESTRPAFESIESVVRAFGSVSFMLESTLGALHASFRAALGVADHLSHLRTILSALSIFRLIQWCVRRVQRMFGVKFPESSLGGCWGDAIKAGEQVGGGAVSPVPSQWPLGAFLGVVLSGSYLAWRLLTYVMGSGYAEQLQPFKGEENEPWVQGKDAGCFFAYGSHDFVATLEQELTFRAGDKLIIAPRSRQPVDSKDWLLAVQLSTQKMGQRPKIGLVPSNYIRFVERKYIRAHGGNPVQSTQSSQLAGVHAQVPAAPQSNPVLQTPLTQSFQIPQAAMHANFNLQSDISPQVFQNSNPVNKSFINIPPLGTQNIDAGIIDHKPAFVASKNETHMDRNNIARGSECSTIETQNLEIKPTGDEAQVQSQSTAQSSLQDTKE